MRKPSRLPRVIAVTVGMSAVVISACGTPSSDITKIGADSYNVSTSAAPARGGSVEAKRIALSEATAFCAKSGKEAFVTNFKTSKNHAEVDFRCEDEGQPKRQQP
jgi:hypothetical protein